MNTDAEGNCPFFEHCPPSEAAEEDLGQHVAGCLLLTSRLGLGWMPLDKRTGNRPLFAHA